MPQELRLRARLADDAHWQDSPNLKCDIEKTANAHARRGVQQTGVIGPQLAGHPAVVQAVRLNLGLETHVQLISALALDRPSPPCYL